MSGAEAILGVVSGGAGLLSLAIQLGESARKLKSFHDSMRNAPETLEDLEFDLQTMALSLEQLERHRQRDSHDAALLARCIERCARCTDKIGQALDKMLALTARSKKMGKIYIAFKEKDVDKLLAELERAKSSLQLALAFYYSQEHARRSHDQPRILSIPAAEQTVEVAAPDSPEPLYGDTATTLARSPGSRPGKQTSPFQIVLRLPTWWSAKIWHVAMSEAINGWNISIRTYNMRPYDSEIFHYCQTGHLTKVQELVEDGSASLSDVSSNGCNLLEVSTEYSGRLRLL